MDQETIIINGNHLVFKPGETILETARRNNIDIPTLCHLKNTIPTHTCKICQVEIKDEGLVESCAAEAKQGMSILTDSPKVIEARKEAIKRLLASGHHNCAAREMDAKDWTSFQQIGRAHV